MSEQQPGAKVVGLKRAMSRREGPDWLQECIKGKPAGRYRSWRMC